MLNPGKKLLEKGFAVVESVYNETEIDEMWLFLSYKKLKTGTFASQRGSSPWNDQHQGMSV